MNKKFIFSFLILGVLILGVGIVSAGLFDFNFKTKITGNAINSDGWTDWFDRDNPSGSGDYETLTSLIQDRPNDVCEKSYCN
jgi:hypothetical protein